MITDGKLDTIRPSGHHLEVMPTAVAAGAAPRWHSMRAGTT
ncbi:MAG: hypothetical protein QOG98_3257 [Pseudonocardiales bacterium]|jgi:hypothetical protein|nr:hypothetical protein [Pseudonocardiales bacterium]